MRTDEIFVRVVYNDEALEINGCQHTVDGSCEINQFIQALKMRLFVAPNVDDFLYEKCEQTIEPQLPALLHLQIREELKRSSDFF